MPASEWQLCCSCFSLLLAELMIGTKRMGNKVVEVIRFQSPISGVNDWNLLIETGAKELDNVSVSY